MINICLALEVKKPNSEPYTEDWDLAKKDFIKFLYLDLAVLVPTFVPLNLLLPTSIIVQFSPTGIKSVIKESDSMTLSI